MIIQEILASQTVVGLENHFELGDPNARRPDHIPTATKDPMRDHRVQTEIVWIRVIAARKLHQAALALTIDMMHRRIRGMEESLLATTDQNGHQMINPILNRILVAGI